MAQNNRIVKNTIYNAAYNLLNVIFPLLTIPIVSRVLMSDGLGKINYTRNIVSWFVLFAALGIPRYGVREISRNRYNQHDLNKCFSENFIISSISTLMSSLVYIISILFLPIFRVEIILYIVTGIQLFFNIFNVDWFYQGIQEYGYITKRSFFVKSLSLIAILLLVKQKDDYIIYALIQSLAIVTNHLFNILYLKKYVKFVCKGLDILKNVKPIMLLLSTSLAVSVYSLLDVTMVGAFCGDSAVGYYTNVHKIINTITIVSTSLGGVLLPQLVYYYSNNEKIKLEDLSKRVLNIIITITLPMTIGIFLLAPQIVLVLFGKDFIPAIPIMKLFAPFIVINSLGNFYGTQLLMAFNKEKELLYTVIIGAVLNFALNFILIRVIQQNGAVFASVLGELVVMLLQRKVVRKEIQINFERKEFIKILTMNIALVILLVITINLLKNDIIVLIISVGLSLILYFSLGYIFKEKSVLYLFGMLQKKSRHNIRE